MKKNGQDLTKTILLSLGAVAATGALTTVVACGVDSNDQANGQNSLTNAKNKKVKLKKIADTIKKFKNKLKGLDANELEQKRDEIRSQIKILNDIKAEQEKLSNFITIQEKIISNEKEIKKLTQHINDENDKWMEQLVKKQAAFEKNLEEAKNRKVKDQQEINVIQILLDEAKKNAKAILSKGKKLQADLIEKQKLEDAAKVSTNKKDIKESKEKINKLINTLLPKYRPTIKGNIKQDSKQVQAQIAKSEKELANVLADIQKIEDINAKIAAENNKMQEMQSETKDKTDENSDLSVLKGTANPKLVYKRIR